MPHIPRGTLYRVAQGIIGLGLGLLLGWLAIRGLDWDELSDALQDFPPIVLPLALGIFLLAIYLRAARWRLLLIGQEITVNRLFLVQNAGIGFNSISPVRVLSEPTQFGILTLRDHLKGGIVLATMAVDRIIDLTVNVVVVSLGILSFPPLASYAPFVAVGAVVSLVGIALFSTIGLRMGRVPLLHRVPLIATFLEPLATLRSHKGRLLAALALSALYWGLLGTSGWLIFRGLDIDLAFLFVVVVIQASVLFSSSVPGLPGAFGTFEFAAMSLLGYWDDLDVPRETALVWTIILHLVLFLPSVLIAILVLPREGMASLPAIRATLERWRARLREEGSGATQ